MKQKRHSVDQVIAKLRRADVELGKGQKVPKFASCWASRSRRTTAGGRSTAAWLPRWPKS